MSKRIGFDHTSRIFKLEIDIFLKTCEAVNTPRSLCCYLLIKNNEFGQYLELPFSDTHLPSFPDDHLVSEMLRKHPDLPVSIDRHKAAMDAWSDAEASCKITNTLIDSIESGDMVPPAHLAVVINNTVSLINKILGPLRKQDLDSVIDQARFGPGATSSCSGSYVVPSRKMISRMDIGPFLYPYFRSIIGNGRWASVITDVKICGYNKVTFVPKSAKTDRAISIEPHLNIFVQLGIGDLIRNRLRRIDIDLDHQADNNRLLAKAAYNGGLATIDLSSASDTISKNLVRFLLPFDWWALLDLSRSQYSCVGDREVRLNKFSSMGNGYTFELESLIFIAIARSCGDPDAVAFGDDIIISQKCAPLLVETLNYLGFKVNVKKSFLSGNFFESCGADYWKGHNVRPFYLKGTYYDFDQAVIRICNKIRTYAHLRNASVGCDRRFLRPWLFGISRSAKARLTAIPINSGDDGLIRNFDEAAPSRARHGWEGFFSTVYATRSSRSDKTSTVGAYLVSLGFGSPLGSRLIETRRGSIRSAQLSRILVKEWRDPGPWI